MKKTYCSECGSVMLREIIPAEEYTFRSMMGHDLTLYQKYDSRTGKRQYVYKYCCPNKQNKKDNHDQYMDQTIIYKETK